MSDIPSGALDAGESRAVSLLARVILPRPGEPLDVRKLYIEESETNARRAHAPTRTTLEIGAESEVSFATYFNAFPASYWRRWSTSSRWCCASNSPAAPASTSTGPRRPAPASPSAATRCRSVDRTMTPALVEFEIDLDAVRGRRLDLVRHHHRHQGHACTAPAGTRRARAGPGQRRRRHPDLQPARRTASTRWRR